MQVDAVIRRAFSDAGVLERVSKVSEYVPSVAGRITRDLSLALMGKRGSEMTLLYY